MNKIRESKEKFKQKVNEYFLFEKSLTHLMKSLKSFYVFSIGFDDMYFGRKNAKRFKICIFNCIFVWGVSLFQLVITSSNDLWSKFDNPFLPDQFKPVHLLSVILFLMVAGMKTNIILGEIYYNLSQYKIIYFLMNDFRLKQIKLCQL